MTELLDFYIERIEREVAVEAHREEAKSRGFWERLTLFGRGGFFGYCSFEVGFEMSSLFCYRY